MRWTAHNSKTPTPSWLSGESARAFSGKRDPHGCRLSSVVCAKRSPTAASVAEALHYDSTLRRCWAKPTIEGILSISLTIRSATPAPSALFTVPRRAFALEAATSSPLQIQALRQRLSLIGHEGVVSAGAGARKSVVSDRSGRTLRVPRQSSDR